MTKASMNRLQSSGEISELVPYLCLIQSMQLRAMQHLGVSSIVPSMSHVKHG